MIGIIVVSHGNIAKEMVKAVSKILPSFTNIVAVSINSDDAVSKNQDKIKRAIHSLDNTDGIIILSDVFGGTPSNSCLPFLSYGKVEIISGVNLPMLIKLATLKDTGQFNETVSFIKNYGRRNIVIASEVLQGDIEQ